MERQLLEVNNGEIKFNLFPKQAQFVHSDIDDLFFGGAVGPGKSTALLCFAAIRRLQHPGTNGIIFRRTFRELEGSLILESKKIYPRLGASWNDNKKCWTFPGGSTEFFGYCEADGDVYHHQTAQYHDICFDELTHFTAFQFNYLLTRARSTIPGVKPLIRCASNPGNVGNDWVKKRYIEPYQTSTTWIDPNTKKTMGFIPAKIQDNPAIMENDPGYVDRLKDLRKISEKKYLALAEGRWDQPEGTFFSEWRGDYGYNVLTKPRIPDTFSMKILGFDWGFAAPACALWLEVTPAGRVFVYRELYINRLSPKELGEKILEMCPPEEEYHYMAGSPEIWGKRTETENGGEVIQQLIQVALGNRIIMQKANNARPSGWLKIREYLAQAPDGYPWMQIGPNCENLVRTLPNLIHDDKKPEDVDIKCFAAGTMIITEKGDFPIEKINIGDFVLTPYGYRKVLKSGQTGIKNVARYTTEDGKELIVTMNHEIATTAGLKSIDNLSLNDMIISYQTKEILWIENKLFTMASFIVRKMENITGLMERISRKGIRRFMSRYGSIIMDQLKTDSRSIIKTIISRTTIFPIWRWSIAWNTPGIICSSDIEKIQNLFTHGEEHQREKQKCERLLSSDGKQFQLENGNVPYVEKRAKRRQLERRIIVLDIAAMLQKNPLLKKFVQFAKNPIAALAARRHKLVRMRVVGNSEKLIPVYNIQIDGIALYYANGLLVANCEDHAPEALRYALVTLNSIPRSIISPHMSSYEKIFGKNDGDQRNYANIPISGRSGYGR